MGSVYRGVDETLGRDVALKILDTTIADSAARLRAEAAALARLTHPGIATIYELVEDDDRLVMVMELVRGQTLQQILDEVGVFSPRRAADLCMQALATLAYAHAAGVVHRDLEARQSHDHRERVDQDHGLRDRAARRRDQPDERRPDARHAGLHGARAGAGPSGGSARRSLCDGRRVLPARHGGTPIQGRESVRHGAGAGQGRADEGERGPAGSAGVGGRRHRPRAGKGSRPALSVRDGISRGVCARNRRCTPGDPECRPGPGTHRDHGAARFFATATRGAESGRHECTVALAGTVADGRRCRSGARWRLDSCAAGCGDVRRARRDAAGYRGALRREAGSRANDRFGVCTCRYRRRTCAHADIRGWQTCRDVVARRKRRRRQRLRPASRLRSCQLRRSRT